MARRDGARRTARVVRRRLGRRHAGADGEGPCRRGAATVLGIHDHHHAPYPDEVLAQLPLAEMTSPVPLIEMVREAGGRSLRIQRLRDVEWAAMQHEPWPLGWLERARATRWSPTPEQRTRAAAAASAGSQRAELQTRTRPRGVARRAAASRRTVTSRPASSLSDVTPWSGSPHATIPSNHDRSVSQLIAKPCSVTRARISRTPIAHTFRSPDHTPVWTSGRRCELDAEVGRRADHDLLHAAQVRGRVRRGAEVQDRVADQLSRTVERERPAAVDPVHLRVARRDLFRGPERAPPASPGDPR